MDEEQQRERADLISRMFALINMKLEDAAGIAADSQGRKPWEDLHEGAEKLDVLFGEAAKILASTAAILAEDR